ncbi:MAG: hypothetical protein NZZ41_02185 [Candidatus Dojkabacteria bacterium]|nr:hypothetical protein [Candidatus Dojkabacteria bacterium]
MRIREILLEYNLQSLLSLFSEKYKLIQQKDHSNKYKTLEEFIKSIEEPLRKENKFQFIEPYIKWIVQKYVTNNLGLYEDIISKVIPGLLVYESLKRKNKLKPNHKDINQIKDIHQLLDILDEYQGEQIKSNTEIEKEIEENFYRNGEAVLVYNDANFKVVIPNTESASCYFGRNTRWCTAATKSENFFYKYNRKGPLYIILDKKNNKRFQFHFETEQFRDESDTNIGIESFKKKYPVLAKLFQEIEKNNHKTKYFKPVEEYTVNEIVNFAFSKYSDLDFFVDLMKNNPSLFNFEFFSKFNERMHKNYMDLFKKGAKVDSIPSELQAMFDIVLYYKQKNIKVDERVVRNFIKKYLNFIKSNKYIFLKFFEYYNDYIDDEYFVSDKEYTINDIINLITSVNNNDYQKGYLLIKKKKIKINKTFINKLLKNSNTKSIQYIINFILFCDRILNSEENLLNKEDFFDFTLSFLDNAMKSKSISKDLLENLNNLYKDKYFISILKEKNPKLYFYIFLFLVYINKVDINYLKNEIKNFDKKTLFEILFYNDYIQKEKDSYFYDKLYLNDYCENEIFEKVLEYIVEIKDEYFLEENYLYLFNIIEYNYNLNRSNENILSSIGKFLDFALKNKKIYKYVTEIYYQSRFLNKFFDKIIQNSSDINNILNIVDNLSEHNLADNLDKILKNTVNFNNTMKKRLFERIMYAFHVHSLEKLDKEKQFKILRTILRYFNSDLVLEYLMFYKNKNKKIERMFKDEEFMNIFPKDKIKKFKN